MKNLFKIQYQQKNVNKLFYKLILVTSYKKESDTL